MLTDRLLLTPIGVDHAGDLERLYSDPHVDYWTGPWTSVGVRTWAQNMADRWARDGVGKWLARDRLDGTLVGRGGLSRTILGDESVLEVGWAVRDELTGRGYASEIDELHSTGRGASSPSFRSSPLPKFTTSRR